MIAEDAQGFKELINGVAIQCLFPGEVNHARSPPAKLAFDDEIGQHRRVGSSRCGVGRLRDCVRSGFKNLLAIGTLLDMSLQARQGDVAHGLGPDQSQVRA